MRILLLLTLILSAAADAADALRLRYERTEGNVLITGHGTAFGIDKRLLLTAKHNVLDEHERPYKTLKFEVDGQWFKCEVLALHDEIDVCVLRTFSDVPVLLLAENDAAERAKVILHGSPRGVPVLSVAGAIERHYHKGSALSRARISFDHGFSGGPVLSNGRVVGMATAGVPKDGDLDKTLCLFLPVSALHCFLAGVKR